MADPTVSMQGAGALGHTRAEWHRRLLNSLGGVGVDPELARSQLDSALQEALELWNRYRPHRQWFPFDIQATQTTVISFFSDEAHTQPASDEYIRRIVRCEFAPIPADSAHFGLTNLASGYYVRWGAEGPRLFFEMQVGQRQYERLTGSRPDAFWNSADRKLYVYSPSRAVRLMALATREVKLEEIDYDQVHLFRKAALAKAKYYLARTLGSKGPIQTGGREIQTDAADIRQEGKDEWKEVEEDLKVSMMSVPPPGFIG